MNRLQPAAARLWSASAPLTAVGAVMLLAFVLSAAGMAIDPRHITGVPAWLKPAKFAISTAIYSLTLAWMFTYLPEWRRTRRLVGWTTAMIFVLEVAIIDAQAWRGKTSHFNAETPVDIALFAIMGLGILIQTLSSIAVAVAVWRHTFQDPALGWALRTEALAYPAPDGAPRTATCGYRTSSVCTPCRRCRSSSLRWAVAAPSCSVCG
jgi:hypothetical protein